MLYMLVLDSNTLCPLSLLMSYCHVITSVEVECVLERRKSHLSNLKPRLKYSSPVPSSVFHCFVCRLTYLQRAEYALIFSTDITQCSSHCCSAFKGANRRSPLPRCSYNLSHVSSIQSVVISSLICEPLTFDSDRIASPTGGSRLLL